ncbi:MAG: DUF4127 family protein [Thermoanaerobacteraceae bacterium]
MFKKIFILIFILLIIIIPSYIYKENFLIPKDDIILIPLDSRPVNTQNVELISKMWGKKIVMPPADTIDNYKNPGDYYKLKDWLNIAYKKNSIFAIIISAQQYLNGGLIASRDVKNYEDYKSRLEELTNFLKSNSRENIIVFSIIPRLTPTQFSDPEFYKYSSLLKQYSILKDKAAISKDEEYQLKITDIKEKIPKSVLEKYEDLFKINEEINKRLIQLTKEGYIKTLIIGLDDTQAYSISNMTARNLGEYAKQLNIHNRIYLLHGADEITMEIVARLANQYYNLNPSFHIIYDVNKPEKIILPYEGADLKKIVEEKINFIGGKIDSNGECILYVHTHENLGIKNDIQKYKNSGQIFGIADVAYANMSDKNLIDVLFDINPLSFLYAGWNTPSNAIGTVISEMSLKMVLDKSILPSYKKEEAIKSFIAFSFIRYTDDFAYQAVVRNKMYKWAESNNIAKDNIDKETADKELSIKMKPLINIIKGKYINKIVRIGNSSVIIKDIQVKVKYPWNRMFEIEVLPDVTIQIQR